MKKFAIIFILSIFLLPTSLGGISYAANKPTYYAKIENAGTFIYSAPKVDNETKLFELPNSYFVRLIENAGSDFYYCAYKDIYGYVLKDEVSAMNGKPVTPFVEANFRVYALEGLGLYSTPLISEQNKKLTIPYLTDTLSYYGTKIGQEAVPDKSSTWIYCKYSYDTSVYGYVYSVFCDKLPTISTNTERFDIVENPFKTQGGAKELTSVTLGFIIVGVSIPCLIVLFLLVKPSFTKEKSSSKTKLKGQRKRDYFEFDDSDLT